MLIAIEYSSRFKEQTHTSLARGHIVSSSIPAREFQIGQIWFAGRSVMAASHYLTCFSRTGTATTPAASLIFFACTHTLNHPYTSTHRASHRRPLRMARPSMWRELPYAPCTHQVIRMTTCASYLRRKTPCSPATTCWAMGQLPWSTSAPGWRPCAKCSRMVAPEATRPTAL